MTPPNRDVSVLLLGAGSGERMGGQPKAFIELDGVTLLERAVTVAARITDDILVGLQAEDIDRGTRIVGGQARVLPGGASRQETIEHLLSEAQGSFVVVHDVARPYATHTHFQAVLDGARAHRACVLSDEVKVRDSLCRSEDGFAGEMVVRQGLVNIQTPQAYDKGILDTLLCEARRDGRNETSLVALVRNAGHPVKLAAGDPKNIKITYPEDLTCR